MNTPTLSPCGDEPRETARSSGTLAPAARADEARTARSADVRLVESFLGDHGATTVTIEMAPWPHSDHRQLLSENGYVVTGREDVVAASSRQPHPTTSWQPQAMPADDWCGLTRAVLEAAPESEIGRLLGAGERLRAQLPALRIPRPVHEGNLRQVPAVTEARARRARQATV